MAAFTPFFVARFIPGKGISKLATFPMVKYLSVVLLLLIIEIYFEVSPLISLEQSKTFCFCCSSFDLFILEDSLVSP
ncbi:MAG: hypothetical protein ACJAS4_002915 [Bacteriovoracaceae bacterium]|jgi:hypothetical protein